MTSPLPAQSTKSPLAESKNAQQGGFLNFCAPQKKSETPSFESFISKNEDHQKRQDELEEAEAAKKRRKQIDAAALATPVANDSPLGLVADLEMPLGFDQSQNKSSAQLGNLNEVSNPDVFEELVSADMKPNTEKPASDTASPDSSKLKTQENSGDRAISQDESTKPQDTDTQEVLAKNDASPEESKHSSDGTKPAMKQDDMVSLSTFEEFQASSAPKALSESSITSANRLTAVSAISERSAISSTENANSGSDASAENFLAANSSPIQLHLGEASHKTATSQASSVFKTLAPEMEKLQQSGQSQVQLELPVGDNESVKIRLSLRAGEIRSTFITESPELRDALQKAWPDFTATHRAQGIRFGESQFQDSFARNQDAASDQGRQRQAQVFGEETPSQFQPKPSARHLSTSQTDRTSSNRVNLWA